MVVNSLPQKFLLKLLISFFGDSMSKRTKTKKKMEKAEKNLICFVAKKFWYTKHFFEEENTHLVISDV